MCRRSVAAYLPAILGGLISGCGSTMGLDEPWSPVSSRPPAAERPAPVRRTGAIASTSDVDVKPPILQRGSGEFTGSTSPIAEGRTTKGGEGVTINLVNAPIAQAAKTILGDVLKLNYVVSDKVTGTVTVQTSTAVDRDALIDIFDAVLRINGAIIQRDGQHYRVVPAATAAGSGVTLTPEAQRRGPGMQTRILSMRHLSAVEMRRLLDAMVPQGAILKVDEARNFIVVNGTGKELANVETLVQTFDVDWMKGMSVGIFPVKSSDPEAIATELDVIFGLDKDGPLKGVVRFVPNRRLGSVLVVSSKPVHIDKAKTWIVKLDQLAEQKEEQLYTYKIQNRPAAELASILQRVLAAGTKPDGTGTSAQPGAGDVAPRYQPATVATAQPSASAGAFVPAAPVGSIGGAGSSMGSSAFARTATPPSSTAPSPPSSNTTNTAPSAAKVIADEQNNALLIQATPKEYRRILRIVEHLDILPTQVMLEAAIAEVSLSDEFRFGMKWAFEKKGHKFAFSNAGSGAVAPTFPGFSYFMAASNINIVLDALSAVTKVNVISAPSLTVMDNRTAVLQVGDQVPVVTQTAQTPITPGAVPVVLNQVSMRDTGVILSVTPRVNDSGRVMLDIEQEVSNVAKTTSSGIDSPTIQQRRVKTTVVVSDGEAVALGGLIQERNNVTKTQVPFLGDIPVVGPAFRTKTDEIHRTELIIIIRPQVLRDASEARLATEEFRSRLHLERPASESHGGNRVRRDIDRLLR